MLLLQKYTKLISFESTHKCALLSQKLYNLTYADSGHWDFVLLTITDFFMRIFVVYTTSPVSEFFIIEKASKRLNSLISNTLTSSLPWNFYGLDALTQSLFCGKGVAVLLLGFLTLIQFLH